MSDRYAKRFKALAERKERAFIPFTLLGYPDLESSLTVIKAMIGCGVTALELGIPFSDPVADGPVIQRAVHETLAKGFKVADAFSLIEEVRQIDQEIPIGILVYYNVVLAHGVDTFFEHASKSGIDGVLIADLPAECADEVLPAAKKAGIELIFIISPVTTAERIKLIAEKAGAFIYLVSRLGVTGTQDRQEDKDKQLSQLIGQIKESISLPVIAGFGISTPEQASNMLSLGADGVITGSRVIEIIGSTQRAILGSSLTDFFKHMLNACQNADYAVKS